MVFRTPHGDLLRALRLQAQESLGDPKKVQEVEERYRRLLERFQCAQGTQTEIVAQMVSHLTEYSNSFEMELVLPGIYVVPYRRTSIVREFLPWLVARTLGDTMARSDFLFTPAEWPLRSLPDPRELTFPSDGMDFVVFGPAPAPPPSGRGLERPGVAWTDDPYLAIEIQSYLDEAIYQEAVARAEEAQRIVPGLRYLLVYEWPNWTPDDTAGTAIEEVILLRPFRRTSSSPSMRRSFKVMREERARTGRRGRFRRILENQPFSEEAFARVLTHISGVLPERESDPSRPTTEAALDGMTGAALDEQIRQIDDRLSAQLSEIIHHEKFRRLESAWRGLAYLVSRTEARPGLAVRALSVTKEELIADLDLAGIQGSVEHSSLAWNIQREFDRFCGTPFGALLGDFSFGSSPGDVALLTRIAGLAARAHAPFLANADPSMFGLSRFSELRGGFGPGKELASVFEGPEHAAWNAFRATEDSMYVALTVPRILFRGPYGREDPLWGSAAWALGGVVMRAFAESGWCARIRGSASGGRVEGLPGLGERNEAGEPVGETPLDVALSEARGLELTRLGFLPLVAAPETASPVFFSASSVYGSPVREGPADGASAALLSAQLPYVFARSRFVHYLRAIMRDRIGTYRTPAELSILLNTWLGAYVLTKDGASEQEEAARPLQAGSVQLVEDDREPGRYWALIHLRPRFQLDPEDVRVRIVVEVPANLT